MNFAPKLSTTSVKKIGGICVEKVLEYVALGVNQRVLGAREDDDLQFLLIALGPA